MASSRLEDGSSAAELAAARPATKPACDPFQLPDGTALLDSQVAGHLLDPENHIIGMLRGPSGRVLKPVVKPTQGEREIAFYENLLVSSNPSDMEIQRHTPTYYGTKEMRVFDKRVKFLELEDITEGMAEPCVMDVKIGRRTWDPLASAEKRAAEEAKYAESKATYGFCITGFQVYRIPSGTLEKYDKNYGKKLGARSVVEALETFLNGSSTKPPSRDLVVQLLSSLWKIQSVFREQRQHRMYSSSLLLAYDAKRLREQRALRQLNNSFAESVLRVPVSRCKSLFGGPAARSLGSLNHIAGAGARPDSPEPALARTTTTTSNNGSPESPARSGSPGPDSPTRSPRINRTIDRLQRLKRSISLQSCEALPEKPGSDFSAETDISESRSTTKRSPDVQVHKLCRTHSYSNNFDADIIEMKQDYATLLSELSGSNNNEEKQNWAKVYMIDFAHVFPAEDAELDDNYLEGVENLIKLLEKFIA